MKVQEGRPQPHPCKHQLHNLQKEWKEFTKEVCYSEQNPKEVH